MRKSKSAKDLTREDVAAAFQMDLIDKAWHDYAMEALTKLEEGRLISTGDWGLLSSICEELHQKDLDDLGA
jgi:hypothetical protein